MPRFTDPNTRPPAIPESPDVSQTHGSIQDYACEVFRENQNSLKYLSRYIRRSYNSVFVMYCLLFVVGIVTAIAAVVKGFVAQNGAEAIPSLIFAGLSATSFFTLFLIRPLESLERNAFFSSWLVAIVTNYWTRLMYLNDPQTIEADLQEAINNLIQELHDFAATYTRAGKGPFLLTPSEKECGSRPYNEYLHFSKPDEPSK